jgi:hypothetical protein
MSSEDSDLEARSQNALDLPRTQLEFGRQAIRNIIEA